MHWLVVREVSFLLKDWRILFEVFVDYLYFMRKVENNVGCVKKTASFIVSILLAENFFPWKAQAHFLILKNYFGT